MVIQSSHGWETAEIGVEVGMCVCWGNDHDLLSPGVPSLVAGSDALRLVMSLCTA